MKKIVTFISALLVSMTINAQVSTYTTQVGYFKGPVKCVTTTGDFGATIDYFNEDGLIEKSVNSAREQYIVFEWTDNTIIQKFYNNTDDQYVGKSELQYETSGNDFLVRSKDGAYYWNFDEMSLTVADKNDRILYVMKTEDKTSEGYNSAVYVNGNLYSKTATKTYDPDQYGNCTRSVVKAADGSEHEVNISYEYYETEKVEEKVNDEVLDATLELLNMGF